MRAMLGLTDNQLDTVMDAARAVPVERRSVFLERTAAMLRLRNVLMAKIFPTFRRSG